MKKSLITISIVFSSGFASTETHNFDARELPRVSIEANEAAKPDVADSEDDNADVFQQDSARGSTKSSASLTPRPHVEEPGGVSPALSYTRNSDGTSSDDDDADAEHLRQETLELQKKRADLGLDPSVRKPITLEELRESTTLTAKGCALKQTLELTDKKAKLGKEIHERIMNKAWTAGVEDGSIKWKNLPVYVQNLLADVADASTQRTDAVRTPLSPLDRNSSSFPRTPSSSKIPHAKQVFKTAPLGDFSADQQEPAEKHLIITGFTNAVRSGRLVLANLPRDLQETLKVLGGDIYYSDRSFGEGGFRRALSLTPVELSEDSKEGLAIANELEELRRQQRAAEEERKNQKAMERDKYVEELNAQHGFTMTREDSF